LYLPKLILKPCSRVSFSVFLFFIGTIMFPNLFLKVKNRLLRQRSHWRKCTKHCIGFVSSSPCFLSNKDRCCFWKVKICLQSRARARRLPSSLLSWFLVVCIRVYKNETSIYCDCNLCLLHDVISVLFLITHHYLNKICFDF
jgi:hypothetical protein